MLQYSQHQKQTERIDENRFLCIAALLQKRMADAKHAQKLNRNPEHGDGIFHVLLHPLPQQELTLQVGILLFTDG